MPGIYGVRVEHVSGNLTDHYDPKAKVLRLSDSVYGSRSVAAVGVAAHECGHAIQDDVDYVTTSFPQCICTCGQYRNSDRMADSSGRSFICQSLIC